MVWEVSRNWTAARYRILVPLPLPPATKLRTTSPRSRIVWSDRHSSTSQSDPGLKAVACSTRRPIALTSNASRGAMLQRRTPRGSCGRTRFARRRSGRGSAPASEVTLDRRISMSAEGAGVPGPGAVGSGGNRKTPREADPRSPRASSNCPRPHLGQYAGGWDRPRITFEHAPQIQSLTPSLLWLQRTWWPAPGRVTETHRQDTTL